MKLQSFLTNGHSVTRATPGTPAGYTYLQCSVILMLTYTCFCRAYCLFNILYMLQLYSSRSSLTSLTQLSTVAAAFISVTQSPDGIGD